MLVVSVTAQDGASTEPVLKEPWDRLQDSPPTDSKLPRITYKEFVERARCTGDSPNRIRMRIWGFLKCTRSKKASRSSYLR